MKTLVSSLLLATLLTGCTSQHNISTNADLTSLATSQQRMKEVAEVNVRLGLAYLQQGQVPLAKQKLLLAVQQNPKSIIALDALGYFLEATGNNVLANKYYRQAILIEPKSGRALNNYGAYLCRMKRYRVAEKYLLAAANELTYINSAAAMENAGLCELGVPNVQQAEIYFKKAIQQDPNRFTSYYELAKINYQKGKYKLAAQYLKDYNGAGSMTAASLWLGIELAKKTGNVALISKNGALLKQHFADSPEYQLYKKIQLP